MNKKLILTSFVALGFACPAMAEPTNTSSTFPDASQNQYMQEDTTYTGAATSTNMAGVYQDGATVYANAQYSDATYEILAGTYLPANSETTIDCDQNGYFCPGTQSPVNYSSSAQGLTQCPTGYGNSGTGASAETDCYRTCTNNDVAHSTGTVNGGYYYGDNNQCEPTACVNGWHVKAGVPDLTTIIGTNDMSAYGYVDNNGTTAEQATTYGLTSANKNTWIVDYGNNKGILQGRGRCSKTPGDNNSFQYTNPTMFELLADETGQTGARYCYCQIDGYTHSGGSLQSLASPWLFRWEAGTDVICATNCADVCARMIGTIESAGVNNLAFRNTLFRALGTPSPATCAANTINISWDGATSASVSANSAGSVTYGGDIRTPQSAIHVPGKVFDGWEFSTTAPQNPVTE